MNILSKKKLSKKNIIMIMENVMKIGVKLPDAATIIKMIAVAKNKIGYEVMRLRLSQS